MTSENYKGSDTAYSFSQLHQSEEGWYMFDAAWKNWRSMFSHMRGESLLDLGCGSGISIGLVKLFRPDIAVTGVELDKSFSTRWTDRGVNVVQDDIFNLQFDSGVFDTVWSSHVLEHLNEPKLVVQESYRVAKKRVIHSVPVGNVDDKNLGTPHIHIFNRQNLSQLFDDLKGDLRLYYVDDSYMSSLIAVLEK